MSNDDSLYPTDLEHSQVSEHIEKFMLEIKPIIHGRIKKELSDMIDEVVNNYFDTTVERLAFDVFSSVRDRILAGLRDYSTAKNYREYFFAEVRKKMVEENKEEITNDYIKDLERATKEKDEEIKYLREYRYSL